MIYLSDPDLDLHQGDALECLRDLDDESIDCVVTSPPYWGLRDYGTGKWEGGDPDCDHDANAPKIRSETNFNKDFNERWGQGSGNRKQEHLSQSGIPGKKCVCGADRVDNQLGLESTPEQYVGRLVEIFREVRRVLVPQGTVWLNLGDSYASVPGSQRQGNGQMEDRGIVKVRAQVRDTKAAAGMGAPARPPGVEGIKPKDIVGIPWMVAFALRADGWYLRSDIIWSKPNPMPESTTDRPTKAHEYVFLLSKRARYYFDREAVKEPAEWARWGDQTVPKYEGSNTKTGWMQPQPKDELSQKDTRNIRTVWTIPTQPYREAHFAVFPEELAKRCILAGCPEGGKVLDPFAGAGTTALVARRLSRHSVLIELNPSYCELIAERLHQLSLLT